MPPISPTAKPVKLIVNGKEFELDYYLVRYEQIVKFAGTSGNPSVTIRKKNGDQGRCLAPGDTVALDAGGTYICNAFHTGNA